MTKNITAAAYAASKYNEFVVTEQCQLLEFIIKKMAGISRNKAKDILAGHGVMVNQKMTTLYNMVLEPGMIVRISKHKRSTELTSRYVKIVYEDKDLVIVRYFREWEKRIG